MVSLGLTWLVASVSLFTLLLVMVQAEKKRGKRLLLSSVRGWFDHFTSLWGREIVSTWQHFVKYIVQLGWYYGLHSFLQAVLKTIVRFYERVEMMFEVNRRRTRDLRAEKQQASQTSQTHLTEMAQHKVDTALTPIQQRKLKDRQLKGD